MAERIWQQVAEWISAAAVHSSKWLSGFQQQQLCTAADGSVDSCSSCAQQHMAQWISGLAASIAGRRLGGRQAKQSAFEDAKFDFRHGRV